ncbi:isocitrate/isopropylmalate family dehydrogenase [Caenispirillum salinarum]|uniref:isocitrate/isopropylmalate family dehydrogenase n=1 Tax=Caenispirillum salinarum TaxID=859058 RepID=UPI00384F06C9
MTTPIPITVCEGDGVGPEITDAVLRILEEAGTPLAVEFAPASRAAAIARSSGALLCGPLTAETARDLHAEAATVAEVRRARAPAPFVRAATAGLDLTVVRALDDRPRAVARVAVEAARAHGRRRLTVLTGGSLADDALADAVMAHAPADRLTVERRPVDAATAQLVAEPASLEAVVVPAVHGAVVAGVATRLAGGPTLTSLTIAGRGGDAFACAHGPAFSRAGRDEANPSGLLLAAVDLLIHLGLEDDAARIHNAWSRTIEDGIHTPDLHHQSTSWRKVGTGGFAKAVITRLGLRPVHLPGTPHGAGNGGHIVAAE